MKIYLDWLKKYVDHGLNVDELSHRLTMGGLELEGLETVELGNGRQAEVMELNVTPNRGYCLSHRGVAREVSALTGKPFKSDESNVDLKNAMGNTSVEDRISVEIQEDYLCPRYSALVIDNVSPGDSPQWLKDCLLAVGLRPINNIVDITNYILMEYGQPLHAFDRSFLSGAKIIVRRAKQNESFTSLDGTELKLQSDALVIADSEKPVALAGIMGGANSHVTLDTKSVVLESAYFDPIAIRKASKKYNLRSDSSYRFERGVDIEAVISAQSRAALMIQELAGGEICLGRVDVYPNPKTKTRILFRISRANQLIGISLAPDKILNYLNSIGIVVTEKKTEDEFLLEIPYSRTDLEREIDLIEEVVRLHGYGNIPVTTPKGSLTSAALNEDQSRIRELIRVMEFSGFLESVNFSFIESSSAEEFLGAFSDLKVETIPLKNPISSEMGTMRTSLLPGLIKAAAKNLNHGQKTVRLFEQGNVFFRNGDNLSKEIPCLAGLIVGPYFDDLWKSTGKLHDFFDMKGIVENLVKSLRLDLTFSPANKPFLVSGQSVDCRVGNDLIGFCGLLNPKTIQKMELEKGAFCFELNLEILLQDAPKKIKFEPIPKYPETLRDISILVNKSVKSQTVTQLIEKVDSPLLHRVELYDQFEGKKLGPDKKSFTFSLAFQSLEKTLTDEEVNSVFDKIVASLSKELGASLRD